MSEDVLAGLETRRLLVCVGCGGVGKTTIAAAIAVGAAQRGRRVLVLTVDPARRLADALGVAELGNTPTPVEGLAQLDVPGHARLDAVMLDMKGTFDGLVRRFADGPETVDRILANPIYQHVSDALAGSAEYSAMEKVYELALLPDYDLVVVDTPPSQHALDFLEAPERLTRFLDSSVVQLLVHPAFAAGRLGFRWFQRGAAGVLRLVERATGVGFLEDLSEFLLTMEGMSEGFRERARAVRALLFGPESAFVLVSSPETNAALQGLQFADRLDRQGVRLHGIVANRVNVWPGEGDPPPPLGDAPERELRRELEAAGADPQDAVNLASAARLATDGYAARARRDTSSLRPLQERSARDRGFFRVVPERDGEIGDLRALASLARILRSGKE